MVSSNKRRLSCSCKANNTEEIPKWQNGCIKNKWNVEKTAKFHLIHRYNHASATTEGDRSITLKAGEEQVFASIEYGGDNYIKFTGDIEGMGGDGGPTPSPNK